MTNELLVITGSLCLIFALFEAWMLVFVFSNPSGKLAELIPGSQDLLKSHVDYLMMSQFLFIFYMLFGHFQIKASVLVVACMCLGSFGNALLFLIRAIKPTLKEKPTPPFHLMMASSCLLTTAGYASGAWLVARSAIAAI